MSGYIKSTGIFGLKTRHIALHLHLDRLSFYAESLIFVRESVPRRHPLLPLVLLPHTLATGLDRCLR